MKHLLAKTLITIASFISMCILGVLLILAFGVIFPMTAIFSVIINGGTLWARYSECLIAFFKHMNEE